jgi:hypothetical protein
MKERTFSYRSLSIIFAVFTIFLVVGFVNNYNYYQNLLNTSVSNCEASTKSYQNLLISNRENCTHYLESCYQREEGYQNVIQDYTNLLNSTEENCTHFLNESYQRENYWANETYGWVNTTRTWCSLYNQLIDLYNDRTDFANSCLSTIGSSTRLDRMTKSSCF